MHFVYLHHVFPEETGPFRELLARLSRESALIGHSEAAKLVSSGAIERSYVSVSFDDGLLNCVEAARILQEFGASGCFFVCPGVVERSTDGAWIADWCRSALDRAPARVMGWAELERLQAMGHEIGNHTMHHVNIAATPRSQRMAEIHAARELLVRRLGDQAGRHFAWPFGHAQHIDEHALQEIHASGHATCSSAVRGVHLPGPSMERTPILLRHLVSFHRPVSSTGLFMRRSVRTCASAFNFGVR